MSFFFESNCEKLPLIVDIAFWIFSWLQRKIGLPFKQLPNTSFTLKHECHGEFSRPLGSSVHPSSMTLQEDEVLVDVPLHFPSPDQFYTMHSRFWNLIHMLFLQYIHILSPQQHNLGFKLSAHSSLVHQKYILSKFHPSYCIHFWHQNSKPHH